MKYSSFAFLIALLILACKDEKRPEGILPEEKMVSLMTDLYVVDGYMSTLAYTDSVRIRGKNFYATIYRKHKVDNKAFERSLEYYSRNPAQLDSLFSLVQANLDSIEAPLSRREDEKRKKSAPVN